MTVHVDARNQVSCCYARRRLRWMGKVDVFVLMCTGVSVSIKDHKNDHAAAEAHPVFKDPPGFTKTLKPAALQKTDTRQVIQCFVCLNQISPCGKVKGIDYSMCYDNIVAVWAVSKKLFLVFAPQKTKTNLNLCLDGL